MKGSTKFWLLILVPIYLTVTYYSYIGGFTKGTASPQVILSTLELFQRLFIEMQLFILVLSIVGLFFQNLPKLNRYLDEKF